jgi:hypothetical protein
MVQEREKCCLHYSSSSAHALALPGLQLAVGEQQLFARQAFSLSQSSFAVHRVPQDSYWK